jgi:transposase-like protein
MKRREWDPKKKAMIVLQGLKGKPVAELCSEHAISQAQYYQWRDQFLQQSSRAFDTDPEKRQFKLEREIVHLKTLVGELTLELKKTDELLGK